MISAGTLVDITIKIVVRAVVSSLEVSCDED